MRHLGIDPGKRGAAAVLEDGVVLDAIHLPLLDDDIDALKLADWLQRMRPDRGWIEWVQPMPSQEDPKNPGQRRGMGAT